MLIAWSVEFVGSATSPSRDFLAIRRSRVTLYRDACYESRQVHTWSLSLYRLLAFIAFVGVKLLRYGIFKKPNWRDVNAADRSGRRAQFQRVNLLHDSPDNSSLRLPMFSTFSRLSFDYVYFEVSKNHRHGSSGFSDLAFAKSRTRLRLRVRSRYSKDSIDVVSPLSNL